MSAHTPGPWHLGPQFVTADPRVSIEYRDGVGVPRKDNIYIAETCSCSVIELGERKSNLRLIAAAPDLLAACDTMLQRWWRNASDADREVAAQASAAIAKAVGK